MSEQIPREVLDKAVRQLIKRAGAVVAQAMAETDTSFAVMAVRLGKPEAKVIAMFMSYIEGENESVRDLAALLSACDCRVEFSFKPIEKSTEVTQ